MLDSWIVVARLLLPIMLRLLSLLLLPRNVSPSRASVWAVIVRAPDRRAAAACMDDALVSPGRHKPLARL